jgi:hypothetical protein
MHQGETMLNKSVVKQSGQLWKLGIAFAALIFGSIAPLFESWGISMTAGTVIAVAGYIFGTLLISCSACGSRWFWEATKDAGWYSPLFKDSKCPACQHEFKH